MEYHPFRRDVGNANGGEGREVPVHILLSIVREGPFYTAISLVCGGFVGEFEESRIVQDWDRGALGRADESILGIRYHVSMGPWGCDCREYRFEVVARSAAYRAPHTVLRISGISKSRRERKGDKYGVTDDREQSIKMHVLLKIPSSLLQIHSNNASPPSMVLRSPYHLSCQSCLCGFR